MRTLALIFLALSAAACSTVHVTVNSMLNGSPLKERPLIFPQHSQEIEAEKLRRLCASAAVESRLSVVNNCGSECYWIVVNGSSGATRETTKTSYNVWTKQTYVSTGDETARTMKITAYADQEMKEPVWQASLGSSGSTVSVLGVAAEICEAGFRVFPNEVTNHEVRVPMKH